MNSDFDPMFVPPKKTAGTLFSGIGGADIGLQQAGFDIAWAIERDPKAASIYAQNFCHDLIVADIRQVNPHDLDRIDLLWASPPCQQYSQARDKSLPVHEGADLGYEVIRFLEILKPQYFCLENVPGYKNADSFKAIVECLNRLGYWSNWSVLNAADYGVPQSRQRLILRAVRGGWLPELPLKQSRRGWYEAISDLVSNLPETSLAPWQIEALSNYSGLPTTLIVAPDNPNANGKRYKAPGEPSWTVTASSMSSRILIPRVGARNYKEEGLKQIPEHQPAPTIRAMGHDGHCHQFNVIEDTRVLRLTPRCYARFQTFPNTFWFPDRPVDAIKGIGNAVPCLLAKTVVEGFLRNG